MPDPPSVICWTVDVTSVMELRTVSLGRGGCDEDPNRKDAGVADLSALLEGYGWCRVGKRMEDCSVCLGSAALPATGRSG